MACHPAEDESPLRVVAGLVFWQERLLISRRPPGKTLAGFWEFPGGKVASGESDEQALRRELMEEVAIEVGPLRPFGSVRHRYSFREVDLHFFAAPWLRGEAVPIECDAVAWIHCAQLQEYTFPPADEQILQRLTQEAHWWR